MEEELIDVRQAASEAGRSAETVRRWIWSGRLAATKRRHKLLVNRAELQSIAGGDRRSTAQNLAEWIADLNARPTFARSPRRASSSDLVLEDRRVRIPEASRAPTL